MDNLTAEQRRKNMQNIKSTNTLPERMFAGELRKRKIKYRKHVKSLPGKPDFVIKDSNIAVFIDSDFFHYNKNKFVMPKTNRKYWADKIDNNILRDKAVNKTLRAAGLRVVRFWVSDINRSIDKCVSMLMDIVLKHP